MKNTEIDNIAMHDFAKSISVGEFIAVLEIMTAIYNNFEKQVVRKDQKIHEAEEKLEQMEKELSAYDPQVRNLRRQHGLMDETLSEEIGKDFKTFIANYDGVVEFLTRFSICETIKKRNINQFKIKKNVKK